MGGTLRQPALSPGQGHKTSPDLHPRDHISLCLQASMSSMLLPLKTSPHFRPLGIYSHRPGCLPTPWARCQEGRWGKPHPVPAPQRRSSEGTWVLAQLWLCPAVRPKAGELSSVAEQAATRTMLDPRGALIIALLPVKKSTKI